MDLVFGLQGAYGCTNLQGVGQPRIWEFEGLLVEKRCTDLQGVRQSRIRGRMVGAFSGPNLNLLGIATG